MNDEQTVQRLRAAMAEETRGHRLDPGAAATALADRPTVGARRRRDRIAVAAALVGAAAVAGGYAAVTAHHDHRVTPPAASSCGPVRNGSLPVWARAGFTPPDQTVPHVLSAGGRIVAILFVELRVHPAAGTNNKILWAARDGRGTGPLVIRASLAGIGPGVTRTVSGGPGPSIIDLPGAGCWHLDLTWGTNHDTIEIPYAP